MRLQHFAKAGEGTEADQIPRANLEDIPGDRSGVWGTSCISGQANGLRGCLTGLTGVCNGLTGDVTRLCGDISGITGLVDEYLIGDVSGLRGDVSGVWGRSDGLRGQVRGLLERGQLWPKDQPFTLEMFASRYKLPMEFFDNSGLPALVAFHALDGPPLHWLAVRSDSAHGFIVGALLEISRRFPGQEIAKVAVPGDADWQICDDLRVFRTDKVYVLEHIEPLVSAFSN